MDITTITKYTMAVEAPNAIDAQSKSMAEFGAGGVEPGSTDFQVVVNRSFQARDLDEQP